MKNWLNSLIRLPHLENPRKCSIILSIKEKKNQEINWSPYAMLQWCVWFCVCWDTTASVSLSEYLIFVVDLPSLPLCMCVLHIPCGQSVSQTAVWWPGTTPPLPPRACLTHRNTLPHTWQSSMSVTTGIPKPSHTHAHKNDDVQAPSFIVQLCPFIAGVRTECFHHTNGWFLTINNGNIFCWWLSGTPVTERMLHEDTRPN